MLEKRLVPEWELKRRLPNKYPQEYFKIKPCRYCEKDFQPMAPSHHFCCDDCKGYGTAQRYFKTKYNLSLKDIEQIYKSQNEVCAICLDPGFKLSLKTYHTLNVDHNHETGVVRGLLCHNCNRALGLLKDSKTILLSAISYLERATTIPQGSTYKCTEAHNIQKDDDIV